MCPRLSPDGRRVAVSSVEQEQDVWLWDVTRATLTRVTFEPGVDFGLAWTPDGQRLLLGSVRLGGQINVWVQDADGTGSAVRLTDSPNQQIPSGTTPDGTRVIVHEMMPTGNRDLRLLTLAPEPRLETLLATRFEERGGVVSPDGRWLAYESDSSGRFEVYVRPFPNVGDGQWQVSTSGGVMPLWARNGGELFYVAPDGSLMAVPTDPRAGTWSAGAPTQVVKAGYFTGADTGNVSRHYDVSADGRRFLMLKESDGQKEVPNLIVVQHWFEELKRLVPTN